MNVEEISKSIEEFRFIFGVWTKESIIGNEIIINYSNQIIEKQ
jgi:hypothetical protein